MKLIAVLVLLGVAGYSSCAQFVYRPQAAAKVSPVTPSRDDILTLINAFGKQKVGANECELCKTIFAAVEKYATDPSFVSMVVQLVVSDVCPTVKKEFPECSEYATRYIPLLFSLLQQVSPNAVCGFIGMCKSEAIPVPVVQTALPALQDDCSDCQTFITDVQKRFADSSAQQQLADTIAQKVCPALGSVFPQCASYAEEYVPIAMQMFESLSASAVCQGIGWCTSATKREAGTLFRSLVKLVTATHDRKTAPTNDQCADCETFITDAQKRYTDPAQQQIIIDLIVNQACPFLSNVFPQCAAYAQEYIPIGFQYLQSFTPQYVCQTTGFCTSVSRPIVSSWQKVALAKTKRVGDPCNDCDVFIAEAQQYYADPQNQQQVVDLASNALCPLVTSVFPECVQFAQTQIPLFFGTFVATDVGTICSYVGLCGSFFRRARANHGSPLVHNFEMKPAVSTPTPNDVCADCTTFFADVLKYYSSEDHQEFVTNELVNDVCPIVQDTFPECADLLPQYMPMVWMYFEALDPSTICTELNFCSSSFSLTKLLFQMATKGVLHKLRTVSASSLCTDCNLVVEVVRGIVSSNSTVNELVATITQVCNIVAEAGRPMCTAMLGAAVREVVYTLQHSTNTQVCATFFAQCAQGQSVIPQRM